MSRLHAYAVVVLLGGSSLTSVTAPSQAVGETCNGLAATMVGTLGGTVDGTPGPDVIVSNGAREIRGNGGDDTVCTTNSIEDPVQADQTGFNVRVLGGPGDDLIDRRGDTATSQSLTAGQEGEDTFFGGPGRDVFNSNDGERDVIDTGGGHDFGTTGGDPGPSGDPDVIDLGPGIDAMSIEDPTISPDLHVSGGEGDGDGLSVALPAGAWTMDAAAGQLRQGTTISMTFDGFEVFAPSGADLEFLGGDADEELVARASLPATDLRARMGGGDDVVQLSVPADPRSWDIDLGAGIDGIRGTGAGNLTIDLGKGRMQRGRLAGRLAGGENVDLVGTHLVVVGGPGPNNISWYGCRGGSVRGGPGDDLITLPDLGPLRPCRRKPVRLRAFGQGGDDVLQGWVNDDELVGGPGRDTAYAGGGRDVCYGVELRHSCRKG